MNLLNFVNEQTIITEIRDVFKKYVSQIFSFDTDNITITNKKPTSSLNVYFDYLDNMFFVVLKKTTRNKELENLVKRVTTELSHVTRMVLCPQVIGQRDKIKFSDVLYNAALLRGMMSWFSGGACSTLSYNIVNNLINCSNRTHENNRIKFGIIIHKLAPDPLKDVSCLDYINQAISATISDGEGSVLVVDKNGFIHYADSCEAIKSIIANPSNTTIKHTIFSPLRNSGLCELSQGGNLGFSLSNNGDICCYKNGQIRLARLNGKWTMFDYQQFKDILNDAFSSCLDTNLIDAAYLSCLDVAFSRKGGCLTIVRKTKEQLIESILPPKKEYINKVLISPAYKNKFQDIGREMRRDLMAIDGATVIYENGEIRAFGAIVSKLRQQLKGGARKAATIALSKYGVAIKISADGYIEICKNGKVVL